MASNKDLSPGSDAFRRAIVVGLPAALAFIYASGAPQRSGTWEHPLGRVPVLDERENLDLAEAIAGGNPARRRRFTGLPG